MESTARHSTVDGDATASLRRRFDGVTALCAARGSSGAGSWWMSSATVASSWPWRHRDV